MRELRCEGNVLHGMVVDDEEPKPQGLVEFRCKSKFCGKRVGVVILHRFDLGTGEYHTRRYLEPPTTERGLDGLGQPHAPVRVQGCEAPSD